MDLAQLTARLLPIESMITFINIYFLLTVCIKDLKYIKEADNGPFKTFFKFSLSMSSHF